MNLVYEQLAAFWTQFHWLRPWWLLSLIPILVISVLLWRQKRNSHQWHQLIAPELLAYLMDGKTTSKKKSLLWVLIAAWCLCALALAGPSWIKRPVPVEKNQNALVILLDLSVSMMSEDVKPSRIARARLKIAEILRDRKDGQAALVVYAGDAHTVTPISDDSTTIVSLLPSLEPGIMPLQGSNTEAAIARGIGLLKDAGLTQGDLLLITDGVVPEAFAEIQTLLEHEKIRLTIFGVGSSQAAPIANGKGGFLRDRQGTIVTSQLNSGELQQLAQKVNGHYSDIANNNTYIATLLNRDANAEQSKPSMERDFDQWYDQGYWLVFLLLPIALLSFKRGFILMLLCVPLIGLTPNSAYALSLEDLWLTKDQQAQRALNAGDAKTAAEQFQTPDWQAAAQYRAGDYAAAAKGFAKSDSANAHYNRGNALAKSGDLEGAIKAYDEAVKRDPHLADAKHNRALAEAALKQQKEQQDQKKDQQDKKDQDKGDQDKNDQQQNDQNKDGQENDSQEKNSQEKDDKSKDGENKDGENKDGQGKDPQKQGQQDSSAQGQGDSSEQGQQNSSKASDAGQKANNKESSDASSATNTESQHQAQSSAGDSEKQSASQGSQDAENSAAQAEPPTGAAAEDNLTDEQKQALEQWLRQVPDDPGGLLRNKFRWQYQQNRQKAAHGEFEPPKNNADQRW